MDIRQQTESDALIVSLHGRLDEFAAPDAEKALYAIVETRPPVLVLDLSEVEYVSSSGLRVLLMLLKSVKHYGGALRLCGLTPFVAEVFEVSNFTAMFDIYPERQAALTASAT